MKDQRDNLKIWQGSCEDILDLIREGSKDYYGPCGANLYDLRVNDTSPNCSMGEDWPSGSLLLQQYMLFPSVLAALNVGNTTRIPKWELCSSIGEVLNNETTRPSSELLPGLLDAGIKVLQFAGAQDLVCNPLSQQWTAGNLSTFSSGLPAEHSFIVDGKTAGSVREGRNWTLVSIEFASHVAPADRPVEIAVMMKRWMEGKGVADGSEGLIVVTATRTATASSGSWRWNANGPFSTMIVSLVAYSLFVLFVPPA